MLNNIVLMGRLSADPELRSTTSGIAVCAFTVAVERDYSGDGEKQADFITVVAWRQSAEFVSRYFRKGSMIVVQGSLQGRKWQDRDGNNRIAWEVQASHVWFGGSKKTEEQSSGQSYTANEESAPREVAQASYQSGVEEDFTTLPDEDLPF